MTTNFKIHTECFVKEGWQLLKYLGPILTPYHAILAGGTALALHLGHRLSIDLDFFTSLEFDSENLIKKLKKSELKLEMISESPGTFLATLNNIKCSLFLYPYPFLDNIKTYQKIKISGILDIAAMKLIAIHQRGTKRDFVDLYFILKSVPFHQIASYAVRRFGKERINPFQIGKSLVYFSDADSDPDPNYKNKCHTPWETIKEFFRKHIKQFVWDLENELKTNQK